MIEITNVDGKLPHRNKSETQIVTLRNIMSIHNCAGNELSMTPTLNARAQITRFGSVVFILNAF